MLEAVLLVLGAPFVPVPSDADEHLVGHDVDPRGHRHAAQALLRVGLDHEHGGLEAVAGIVPRDAADARRVGAHVRPAVGVLAHEVEVEALLERAGGGLAVQRAHVVAARHVHEPRLHALVIDGVAVEAAMLHHDVHGLLAPAARRVEGLQLGRHRDAQIHEPVVHRVVGVAQHVSGVVVLPRLHEPAHEVAVLPAEPSGGRYSAGDGQHLTTAFLLGLRFVVMAPQ